MVKTARMFHVASMNRWKTSGYCTKITVTPETTTTAIPNEVTVPMTAMIWLLAKKRNRSPALVPTMNCRIYICTDVTGLGILCSVLVGSIMLERKRELGDSPKNWMQAYMWRLFGPWTLCLTGCRPLKEKPLTASQFSSGNEDMKSL